MPTEAGRKMQACINAVCRMHASVSKLLVDFDKYVAWPSRVLKKSLQFHSMIG
jgi:DNA relaxase NicK